MQELQKMLVEKGVDAAVLISADTADPSVFYLTGYVGSGVFVIPALGRPVLFASSRDEGLARGLKDIELRVVSGKILEQVKTVFGNFKKIGIDFNTVPIALFEKIKKELNAELIDISKVISGLRMVKHDDEIVKIQRACKISDDILKELVKHFNEFKTESEAAAFLVHEARRRGCGLAFEPIVASGKNASVPHHLSNDVIHKGFCIVDFGVTYEGYCSDITRTFYLGKPREEEIKKYHELLDIQKKCIAAVRAGVLCKDLHAIAANVLGKRMNHSLGHGMGVEVHELPIVSSLSNEVLHEGMVITIEPGDYLLGKYGIRIEDDVLVTNGKPKVLNKFSKELTIIS